jgi:hypothetical protein
MSELTVREIRERKSALEGEIAEAIKRFEIESGVNVSALNSSACSNPLLSYKAHRAHPASC